MRYFLFSWFLVVVAVVLIAGFRGQKSIEPPIEIFPDMDRQAKVKAQVTSEFFADGRGNRMPVEGTVPVGYEFPVNKKRLPDAIQPNAVTGSYSSMPVYLDTGKIGGNWGTGIPVEVNQQLLERGRQRYDINCAVCHGATGQGNGIVGQYGMVAIANYHQDRIRQMPDGELFNVIANGKNTMKAYGHQINVHDRWAIVSYIRALQLSQNVPFDQLPEGQKKLLKKE